MVDSAYVALSDPGFMNVLGQSPHNWKRTMHQYEVPTIFHTQNIRHHVWKIVRTIFQCIIGLQSPGEGLERYETRGQICPLVFLLWMTFSPQLENNDTLQGSSDNFPYMVTYLLCMENCRNCILIGSCLPIAGRLS